MKTVQETMMSRCLELAYNAVPAGNYPLGSLVAIDNTIIAEASSKLIVGHDPTAHPEMVAIRQAAKAQETRFLKGATLYTTLEPCPMCTGAAVWAKMGGIVFGASQEDAIAWGTSNPDPVYSWRQIGIKSQQIVDASNRSTTVTGGVLRGECQVLFPLVRS